jgi:hypothetical protein
MAKEATMNTTQTLPSKVQSLLDILDRNAFGYSISIENFNDYRTIITVKSTDADSHADFVCSTFMHTVAHTTESGRRMATSTTHCTYHSAGAPDKKETRNAHQAICMWSIHSRNHN